MTPQRIEPVPCQETDPEIFFTDINGTTSIYTVNAAKKICNTCWFKSGCLDLALGFGDIPGVWGGMTKLERRRVADQRKIKLSKYYANNKGINMGLTLNEE
jgi:WhiB family redox-sensing transcriptional regulator